MPYATGIMDPGNFWSYVIAPGNMAPQSYLRNERLKKRKKKKKEKKKDGLGMINGVGEIKKRVYKLTLLDINYIPSHIIKGCLSTVKSGRVKLAYGVTV